MQITVVGLDIAKHVFQAHAADADGRAVAQVKLRRAQVLDYFARDMEPLRRDRGQLSPGARDRASASRDSFPRPPPCLRHRSFGEIVAADVHELHGALRRLFRDNARTMAARVPHATSDAASTTPIATPATTTPQRGLEPASTDWQELRGGKCEPLYH